MPKGQYDRQAAAVRAVGALPPEPLNGRGVYRIMLHNGVHLGLPPAARVERSILAAGSPYRPGLGHKLADGMTLTPVGVHVSFEGEGEKLIPYANIYEIDLAPPRSAPAEV